MNRRVNQLFASGVVGLALVSTASTLAHGQQPDPAPAAQAPSDGAGRGQGQGRGQFAGMSRVAGEVTAVSGNTLTVKTAENTTVQVITTDNTRLMKERGPVKITDLHPGDGVMAIGNMDAPNQTLHAAVVMAQDAAQLKAMRENLGRTYITGRVTAIDLDNAKMTVERPDHVSQTIGFDETTSFKRAVRGERSANAGGAPGGNGGGGEGRGMRMGGDPAAGLDRAFAKAESITLADVKVGDGVVGTGSVKAGVFVPTRVLDAPRGQRRQGSAETPAPAAPTGQAGPGSR